MPGSYLSILIDELRQQMDAHIAAYRDGLIDADTFEQRAARDLAEHHLAAYLVGREDQVLRADDKRILAQVLGDQIDYLNGFADVLAANEDQPWTAVYEARARLYAGALTETYWRGQTRGLDLPGYPTVGTECIVNDQCSWRIDYQDDGRVFAYWTLGEAEHCPTCRQRAQMWNPYIVEAA